MLSPFRNDYSPARMRGTLGPEIIIGGDFPDLSGFALNAAATGNVAAIGGEMLFSAPHGDYAAATAVGAIVVGARYEYTFTVNPKTSVTAFAYVYSGGVLLQAFNCNGAASGQRSGVIKAANTTPFQISVRTDGVVGIAGVSVRRVR